MAYQYGTAAPQQAMSYVAPQAQVQAGYVAQSAYNVAPTIATGGYTQEVCQAPAGTQTSVAYQQYEVQQPVNYQVQKVENVQVTLKHRYQVPIYTETQCIQKTFKGQPQLVGTDRGETVHMGGYTQQPTQGVGYVQQHTQAIGTGYAQHAGGSYVVQGGAAASYAPVNGGAYSTVTYQ